MRVLNGNRSPNSTLASCPNHSQSSRLSKNESLSGFIGAKLRAGMEPEPSIAPLAQFCVNILENS